MMDRNTKEVTKVDKVHAAKENYDLFFEVRKHHMKDEESNTDLE
jgi:hypothetical protein